MEASSLSPQTLQNHNTNETPHPMACNNQAISTERSSTVYEVPSNTEPRDRDAVTKSTELNIPQTDGQNIETYVEHVNSSLTELAPVQDSSPGMRGSRLADMSWPHLMCEMRERRTSSPGSSACAMCNNYENQLQVAQLRHKENKMQLLNAVTELDEKKKKVQELSSCHAELESMLEARVTSQQAQLFQLEDKMKHMTIRFDNLLANYRKHRTTIEAEFIDLQKLWAGERADFHLLQSHYDSLVGRRTRATAELSEQPINIPSDKTELELLTLKLYEENLALRAAREHLDDRLVGYPDPSSPQDGGESHRSRSEPSGRLRRQLDEMRAQVAQLEEVVAQRDAEATLRTRCDEQIKELRTALAESQAKMAATAAELATTRTDNDRLQAQVVLLQTDLQNTESVQADFVRLSQNLQIQLERLRQEDKELRWVDPDLVTECYACHSTLTSAKKVNCRHCGKVHCPKCLHRFNAPNSPRRRSHPVCGLCYTLLNKHVAPYFSIGDTVQADCSPKR